MKIPFPQLLAALLLIPSSACKQQAPTSSAEATVAQATATPTPPEAEPELETHADPDLGPTTSPTLPLMPLDELPNGYRWLEDAESCLDCVGLIKVRIPQGEGHAANQAFRNLALQAVDHWDKPHDYLLEVHTYKFAAQGDWQSAWYYARFQVPDEVPEYHHLSLNLWQGKPIPLDALFQFGGDSLTRFTEAFGEYSDDNLRWGPLSEPCLRDEPAYYFDGESLSILCTPPPDATEPLVYRLPLDWVAEWLKPIWRERLSLD